MPAIDATTIAAIAKIGHNAAHKAAPKVPAAFAASNSAAVIVPKDIAIPGSIFPIEEKPDIIIGEVINNVELICSNFSQPVNSSLLIVFQIPLTVVPRVTKVVKPFTIS